MTTCRAVHKQCTKRMFARVVVFLRSLTRYLLTRNCTYRVNIFLLIKSSINSGKEVQIHEFVHHGSEFAKEVAHQMLCSWREGSLSVHGREKCMSHSTCVRVGKGFRFNFSK